MLNFPKETLKTIKQYLLRQKKEVDQNLKRVEETDPAHTPFVAESSEPGTDSYIADTHTKTVVLKDQLARMSSSIRKTLSKIGQGSFGKCEKCGQHIELGRLLAMPTAEYCLSCSRKRLKSPPR